MMRRGERRGQAAPIWKRLLIGVAIVEFVLLIFLIVGRSDAPPPTDNARDQASSAAAPHVNRELGFEVATPKGWQLDDRGAVTKLLSPGNDIAVALGPAPSGDLFEASDVLVTELSTLYRGVEVDAPDVTRVDGDLGLIVEGKAVNDAGVPVRFSMVTVEGAKGNFAVSAFASPTVDRKEARARLDEILGSIELG